MGTITRLVDRAENHNRQTPKGLPATAHPLKKGVQQQTHGLPGQACGFSASGDQARVTAVLMTALTLARPFHGIQLTDGCNNGKR